jgi:CBS domain-containing protein
LLRARRQLDTNKGATTMRVKDVMTRDAKPCRGDQTLAAAAKTMWDHDCGCVPIVDDQARVIGMLTDRDICMAALGSGRPLHDLVVSDAMARSVVRCTPDDPLDIALRSMSRARVRRLPVVSATGKLAGILSLHDAARAARHSPAGWLGGVSFREVGRAFAEVSTPREKREGTTAAPRPATLGA